MDDKTYEFDVVVTVRKRIWVSGPETREVAREVLTEAIKGGIGFGPFVKRGKDGHPIEAILSNDLALEDA